MPTARRWWTFGSGVARHARDREIAAVEQPGLAYTELDGALWLAGSFVIQTASGIPDKVGTGIWFPPTYPTDEPAAFVLGDQFEPRSPQRHFMGKAQCCLWLDAATLWDPRDPDALRPFLDQLAVFYERQFIYDQTGVWPGPAWGHDDGTYIDYLLEEWAITPEQLIALEPALRGAVGWQSRCPCGSGRKYPRCHQKQVDGFLERGGRRLIEGLRRHLADAARAGRIERLTPDAPLVGPHMKVEDGPAVEPPSAEGAEETTETDAA